MIKYNKINDKYIDEIAKQYALTNKQLLDFLLLYNIDALNDTDIVDKKIENILKKLSPNLNANNHKNTTSLHNIKIEGLFGKFNYSINFDDDISIWVSENGIGKTTILNIIVAILNYDQKTLLDINFKKIEITLRKKTDTKIDTKTYIIDKEEYSQIKNSDDKQRTRRIIEELSMYIPRRYYIKLRNEYEKKKYIDLDLLKDIIFNSTNNETIRSKRFLLLYHKLEELQYRNLSQILYKIKDFIMEDIIFYPTYRRVEVGVDKIFFNNDEVYNQYELSPKYIAFGMNDVKNRIDNLLDKMRKDANSAYIEMNANIISELLKKNIKEYIQQDDKIDINKVNIIIKRIGEDRIENLSSLKTFLSYSVDEKNQPNAEFLLYYLQKLVKIYDEQKPLDTKLSNFAKVCSKYLSGKKIIYDEASLSMNVYGCNNEKIAFEDLSSGEKQVISIFSKVYLDVVTPCIFIIDEPEISLSIEWQKEFLKDIYDSKKIGLMIVTTHSPFIFKNEYRKYVVELEKYMGV